MSWHSVAADRSTSGIRAEWTAVELRRSDEDNYTTSIRAEHRCSSGPFQKGRPSLRLKSESRGPNRDDA